MSLLDRLSSKSTLQRDEYTRVFEANAGLWAIGIPDPRLPAPAHYVPDMKGYSTQHTAIGEEYPVNLERLAPLAVWFAECKDLRSVAGRRIRLMTADDAFAWFNDNAKVRGCTAEELYEEAVADQDARRSGNKAAVKKPATKPKLDKQSLDAKIEADKNAPIVMESPVNVHIQSMCSAASLDIEDESARMSEHEFMRKLRGMTPRVTKIDLEYLQTQAPYANGRKWAREFKLNHETGIGPAPVDAAE